MFAPRQRPNCHPTGLVAFVALCLNLLGHLSGCSLVYPEIGTPIRSPANDQPLEPEPPSDVLYLSVKSARIPSKTRDGRSWDRLGGSAPDVYAVLFVDQVEVQRTDVIPDSFEPTWKDPKPANYRITPTSEIRIELWDENALVSHPICNQVVDKIADSADVGELEVSCDSGATVLITVAPPKAKIGMGLFVEIEGKIAKVTRVIAASSAGRAGIKPDERLVSVRGRTVASMTQGELESVLKANASGGLPIEIKGKDGEMRKIELREEAMYPVQGEGVDLH